MSEKAIPVEVLHRRRDKALAQLNDLTYEIRALDELLKLAVEVKGA